jgi:glucosamine--fructose-6-phosphate aminotransferase (isomerizing)
MQDFMLLEIQQQPIFLKHLFDAAKDVINQKTNEIKDKHDVKRIILTGSGDSLSPMELSRYRYKLTHLVNENTLLIPISVSGHTPRVIEAIHAAKSRKCPVLAITNNPESPVTQLADDFLYAKSSDIEALKHSSYEGKESSQYVGYEHDVPQTKSYTAVQMTLQLLAESFQKDPDYSKLKEIPEIVKKIVENPLIKELGVKYSRARNHIYSASGPNYGNSLFGEFKMYEFSLPGFSKDIEEYCHTAYFITEKETPVMFLAPEGESLQRVTEISPILKDKIKAKPIILSNKEPAFNNSGWIEIPFSEEEEYSVIPYGVVVPLFAFWVAKERGLNVNTFRGGVEQEKYVAGSLHTIRKSNVKTIY